MPIKNSKIFHKIYIFLDKIHLPVLDISLWGLLEIYIGGLFRNKILKQANTISWSLFLSLFPFILFLLSVLPYFPHYSEVHDYIFNVMMPRMLPEHMLVETISYVERNITPKIKEISSFTIILVLIFATNGTRSMINGFNENTRFKRKFIKEYCISFGITLGFISFIFLFILGIYYTEIVVKLLVPEYQHHWLIYHLTRIIGYVSFPLFYVIALSLFYWTGTVKINRFPQAIPGAIFTTILFVVTTYGFAFYVKEFAGYNVLYGSVGSMILLMIWVNVNVILILLGNELNITIKRIHIEKEKKKTPTQ